MIEQGEKAPIVVSTNAGVGRSRLARLLELGRVLKSICSFPSTVDPVGFDGLYRTGKIELEIVPQGTMAERMRAAGAGVGAFFTPTGVGTKMAEGKEVREIGGGGMGEGDPPPGARAPGGGLEAGRSGRTPPSP